ncbi:MAG TPA: peptidyl-prolyl cis-trans isomerase [Candidatus Limnocylindria bacterium]|nr:peptidyl-prolyl cis-trans isomerase [Candidatus Limnocylindria bacterium]
MHSISTLRSWSAVACCLALGVGAAWLAGCGGDEKVLARVGDQKITVEDFTEAARTVAAQYPPIPDSAKAMLLRDLVQRQILLHGANQAGYYRDTLFLDFKQRTEAALLREELFQRMVGGEIPVSNAEIEAFHKRRNQEVKTRVVFAMTREIADQALAELKGGAAFATVADKFNPGGMLPAGGDLGYLVPGTLVSPLDESLLSAPVGEVVGPLEAPAQGWFLMLIEERRPRPQAPLADDSLALTTMIRQRKQRTAALKAVDQLRNSYHVKVNPGGAQRMITALRPDPMADASQLMSPPPLSESTRAEALATYDGGVYTLGDALKDLETSRNRPNLSLQPTVERWIESQAIDHTTLLEARKRRLQNEPAIERKLRERLNNYLLDAYYDSQVSRQVQITDADVRATYESRASSFQRLDEARLLAATFPDSASAAQLQTHAGHAGTLREAAAMAGGGIKVREERVKFPNPDPFWSGKLASLLGMSDGEYSGPFKTERGWVVLQLVSKQVTTEPFETLPPMVQQSLRSAAVEQKRDGRLTALTDSLRKTITIVENREALKKVEWPAPEAPAPGTPRRIG